MGNTSKTKGTGLKKVIKIVGIVLLAVIIGIAALLKYLGSRPAAPTDYQQSIETGGECTGTGYLRNRDRVGWPWISWETLGYALETAIFRREKFKMKNQVSFILPVKTSLFYQ